MTLEQPLRFTSVSIVNWRNFAGASVDLQRRAFLVGPNASGKSNFLDVFRFLRDIAAVGGGLQESVKRRGGLSRLRCLAARRNPGLSIRVSVGTDEEPSRWEYVLQFGQDPRKRLLVVKERVLLRGKVLLSRLDEEDRRDVERRAQTSLEQVSANREFRDLADFFGSVRYLHLVPQLVREPERSVGYVDDPYGGDFLDQVARTPEKTQRARLRRIRDALRVAVPQLQELELVRDERGTPHLRGKYEHWRPQGARQTEGDLSDGTLRLLGLLWAALDGDGPLLLEEPELSLHPEVVRHLPQMFARMQRRSGRQVIVSTHSHDLLRDEGIGLDETLLFVPGNEGTSVRPASDFLEIPKLLLEGSTLADAVMPRTAPQNAAQLLLFSDPS